MLKLKNNKGYTIIELLLVLAIISILVLLATPRFLNYLDNAKVTAMQADVRVLSNSAMLYNIDNPDSWPVQNNSGGDITYITVDNSNLKSYLIDLGIEKSESNEITAKMAKLNEEDLNDYVKTLANKYSDYFIVLDGKLQGNVFHLNGVSDSSGKKQYGIDLIK